MNNKDLPKAYEPQQFEDALYTQWNESGFFNPDVCVEKGITKNDAEVFSMVLPPPNVTGTLHLGHAMMLAIEDVVTRFARMRGKKTLWLPGTDHAAIATQSKVEKIIHQEEGKNRHDFSREEFLARVDQFAQDSHDTIINQTKKMGASLDWSREAYTLDEKRNLAVRTAFNKMYEDGLIYRGNRIVNWDPNLKTTVSDDEVDYIDKKGKFYYFTYGPFEIGTARPETKFGDKYVVMHPNDERYKEYKHGQKLTIEWINGPIEATIIKDEVADMDFGTGVMTITPWHSVVDFELAQKYNLDAEQVIDFDGKLLPIAQEFAGMHITDAREKIVEKLNQKGLLIKVDEEYENRLATNSRGGGVIEPQVKEQWFIGVNNEFQRNGETVTLKSLMQKAVRGGDINIIPERFNKIYFSWIDGLHDWCISRQIWFGHRVPAYYCMVCHADFIQVSLDEELAREIAPISGGNVGALLQMFSPEKIKQHMVNVLEIIGGTPIVSMDEPKQCDRCGHGFFVQDPDTLDTWFSAGLWTFSTLGWPEKTDDLKTYHPTTLLETGYDIIFFWVARMILMSTYLLDEVPFKHVYLHGLVRDEKGTKMSKSLDNAIDPLDMINTYGADATRLSLMVGIAPGNDAKLSEEKVAGFRNFTNKLYNIGRYVLTTTEESSLSGGTTKQSISQAEYDALPWEDQWILGRLKQVSDQVTQDIQQYNVARALDTLKQFTWSECADWYIEISKVQGNKDEVLRYVLDVLLRLWHPAMPFVTEHMWKQYHDDILMVQQWPSHDFTPNKQAQEYAEMVQDIVTVVRNLRAESRVPAAKKVSLVIEGDEQELHNAMHIIKALGRIDQLTVNASVEKPESAATAVTHGMTIYLPLEGIIDATSEKERLQKEIDNLTQYITKLDAKLANESFIANAPHAVVEIERTKLAQARAKQETLTQQLKSI